MNKKKLYESLGVSASKKDVHAAIVGQDKGLFPGAFCKILPDIYLNSEEHCVALHADGAGTKSIIAYLMWKETGDDAIFRGLAQDSLVMNLDDLICIGATNKFVLSNTIGRNAQRISGGIIREIIEGYEECARMLSDYGVTIFLGGGETADVGDLVSTVIIDSTLSVRMKKEDVVSALNIKPRDKIVSLASDGMSSYENVHNSGIGSNGLTAARHLLLKNKYAQDYPEVYSSTLKASDVFMGSFSLKDKFPNSLLTVGEALLSPTRTYAPFVKQLLNEMGRNKIHGILHNSGGGMTKSLKFGYQLKYIKNNPFPLPPIFQTIHDTGNMSMKEMHQVFNCGQRLEVYVEEGDVSEVQEIASSLNIDSRVVGHVEASDSGQNEVIIERDGETYQYFD